MKATKLKAIELKPPIITRVKRKTHLCEVLTKLKQLKLTLKQIVLT